MRSPHAALRFGALALVLAAGGCASSVSATGSAAGAPQALAKFAAPVSALGSIEAGNATGTYSGTVQDSVSGLGAASLQIVQYDGTVQGTGEIVDDQGYSAVSIAGTVTGKTISGSITVQSSGCVYGVSLTVKGKKLSGSYTPTGSCTNSGTTALAFVPGSFNASGKYTGAFYDETDGSQAGVKLSLVQSGSGLSGQFTTKSPAGNGSGSISGTLSEAVATVGIQVANDSCSPYDATLIAYGKSFYGYYSSTVCTLVGYIALKK